MKYPKMPGGIYRGTAQPDVQWKLQQMQDADNYYAQALSMLVQVSPLCPNFHFFALYKKRSFK